MPVVFEGCAERFVLSRLLSTAQQLERFRQIALLIADQCLLFQALSPGL